MSSTKVYINYHGEEPMIEIGNERFGTMKCSFDGEHWYLNVGTRLAVVDEDGRILTPGLTHTEHAAEIAGSSAMFSLAPFPKPEAPASAPVTTPDEITEDE